MPPTAHARAHDWLHTTGGAIGFCLPNAVGAAIACPGRQVVALTGDGSAMYTLQSLWTMARENLKVVTLVFANRGYQILRSELANVGRYNIAAKPEGEVLEVTMPNMARTVKVKGALLRENLSFVVFMPKDLKVETLNTTDLLAAEKK